MTFLFLNVNKKIKMEQDITKNKEKIQHFCDRVSKIADEISIKKEPCECTFKLYFDAQGQINANPTEIITHKRFII